jgi:DNA repair protein RadA/Sms
LVSLEPVTGTSQPPPRLLTNIAEFDRVCGGGLVPGSALLIGGDPGIGKSTLLLQVLTALAQDGKTAIYISGEEGIDQTRLRAKRLGLEHSAVKLAAETSLRDILSTLESAAPPAVLVVDSIQTLWADSIEAAPGTVSQVRACSQELIRYAKRRGTAVLLIGHVTKDGQIAGPRVVEHMVDAVLYFEGERGHQFRILRAVKNRFGPTDEIGVFEMLETGLAEVSNPSALFLGPKESRASGAAVFAGVEGTRPLLVEIQALVAQASYGAPRRAVVGWDAARLAMVLAVLDARAGIGISALDVYLNVAGGLRIGEPAADLVAAGALVSSHLGVVIPHDCVFFGEISLSGTIRAVGQADARLKEAQKLGFKRAFVPPGVVAPKGIEVTPIPSVGALIAQLKTFH